MISFHSAKLYQKYLGTSELPVSLAVALLLFTISLSKVLEDGKDRILNKEVSSLSFTSDIYYSSIALEHPSSGRADCRLNFGEVGGDNRGNTLVTGHPFRLPWIKWRCQ